MKLDWSEILMCQYTFHWCKVSEHASVNWNDFAAGMTAVLNPIHCIQYMDYKLTLPESTLKYTMCKTESMCKESGFMSCSPYLKWIKDMDGACNVYGGEEKGIQGFGGETSGKETTWKN